MRRWQAFLLSIILPPIGIFIVLFRPLRGKGFFSNLVRVVGRLVVAGVLAILTLVILLNFGVIHFDVTGAARPFFTTIDPQSDLSELEKHRAAMKASAPPPPPMATPAETPASATAAPASPTAKTPAAITAPPAPAPQPAWAEFRGAKRDGVYTEGAILTSWPADGLKPLWKQPIGGGFASFSIAHGVAYTIEQRRDKEVVVAYDVASGREHWTHEWTARYEDPTGDGPRATPTWHDGLLYALGATGEMRALDAATGKPVWSTNILTDNGASNIAWGMANSPLIVDEKVVVTPGGRGGKSLVAYHKKTGERIWGSLDDGASYSSPALVTLAGMRQIVVVTATRAVGLRPEDGKLLWEYPWQTQYDINSAQPVVIGTNQVFVSSGYDHGAVLLEITANDRGLSAKPLWENKNMKNRFNSSVLRNGHLYGFDESIFACIDARTGERKWKAGRYGYGQSILAGDHIIVLTETGELVLLKASPDAHQEITRSPAIEGKTWNNPAISNGVLLVRNTREMAAFRIAQ